MLRLTPPVDGPPADDDEEEAWRRWQSAGELASRSRSLLPGDLVPFLLGRQCNLWPIDVDVGLRSCCYLRLELLNVRSNYQCFCVFWDGAFRDGFLVGGVEPLRGMDLVRLLSSVLVAHAFVEIEHQILPVVVILPLGPLDHALSWGARGGAANVVDDASAGRGVACTIAGRPASESRHAWGLFWGLLRNRRRRRRPPRRFARVVAS